MSPQPVMGTVDAEDASDLLAMLPDVSEETDQILASATSIGSTESGTTSGNNSRGPIIINKGQRLKKQSIREDPPTPPPPNTSRDRSRTGNRQRSVANERPTVNVECVCGRSTRVIESPKTRKKRCRQCRAEILIPGTEAPAEDTVQQLHKAIDDAVNQPASGETSDRPTARRKLSSRAIIRIEQSLEIKNPLSESEARQRSTEILKAAKLGDPALRPALEQHANDEFSFVRETVAKALSEFRLQDSTPVVLPLLTDAERPVVCAAIHCLKTISDPRAVLPLLWLARAREDVRLQSLDAVAQISKNDARQLNSLAVTSSPDLQADIASVLGKLAHPDSLPVLISLLNKSNAESVRMAAIEAIGRIGDTQTAAILTGLLKDPSRGIRRNAVIALQKVPTPQATTFLVPLLKEPDNAFRCNVIKALVAGRDARCVPHITPFVYQDEDSTCPTDEPLHRVIAESLGELEHEAAGPALSFLLESEFDSVVLKSISAIRKRGLDSLAPPIADATTHRSSAVRRLAAETLGELDYPEAVEILCQLVESDPSEEVCVGAVRGLGKLGDSLAVPALEKALKRESSIRCAAVVALGEIRSPSGQAALLAMLKDIAPEVRYQAAMALAKMDAQNARQAIEQLLTDPDPLVQTGAQKALEKLGAKDVRPPLAARLRSSAGRVIPDWAASFLPRSPAAFGTIAASVLVAGLMVALTLNVTAAPSIVLRGDVSDIRFSPNGSRLLVTRSRGAAELWDLNTGSIARDVAISSGSFGAIAADEQLAVLIAGNAVTRWPSDSTSPISEGDVTELTDSAIRWADFPVTGEFGVCAGPTEVMTWDLATGERIGQIPVSPLGRFALNSTGSTLVESVGTMVRYGNPTNGTMKVVEVPLTKEDGQVRAIAVNNEGNLAALCLTTNHVLLVPLLDESGEVEVLEAHTGPSAAFGPDGRLWLVHSNSLSWLNVKSRESHRLDIEDVDVLDRLAISPDGLTAGVASSESDLAWLIDTSSLEIRAVLAPPSPAQ